MFIKSPIFFLILITNNIKGRKIEKINKLLVAIKVPHIFNRKPVDLREVSNWKSTEIMLFMFYESIPIFMNTIYTCETKNDSNVLYEINKQHLLFFQYTAYVIAVRILHEPIQSEEDLKLAESILINYCKEIEDTFNLNACTYTLHAHLHLVEQVRNLVISQKYF